jgi:hypothetical protein
MKPRIDQNGPIWTLSRGPVACSEIFLVLAWFGLYRALEPGGPILVEQRASRGYSGARQ